jgi:hypothetical protein
MVRGGGLKKVTLSIFFCGRKRKVSPFSTFYFGFVPFTNGWPPFTQSPMPPSRALTPGTPNFASSSAAPALVCSAAQAQ